MPLLRDSAVEQAELKRIKTLDDLERMAEKRLRPTGDDTVDTEIARDISQQTVSYGTAYADMDAILAFRLAEGGIAPDSEIGQKIAQNSVEYGISLSAMINHATGLGPGVSPLFDDDGTYLGDEDFSPERNADVIFEIEAAVAGGADREGIYESLRSGSVTAQGILDASSEHFAPYRKLLSLVPEASDDLIGRIYALPSATAEELAREEWVERDGDVVSASREYQLAENTATAPGYDGRMSLGSVVNELLDNDVPGWRDQVYQVDTDAELRQETIRSAISSAAVARGDEDPFAVPEGDDGGGFGIRNLTRGAVQAFGFFPQMVTNRFRQNFEALGAAAPSLYQGGGPAFGNQGVVPGAAPISGDVQRGLEAASGYAGLFTDSASMATAIGPVGGGVRSIAALTPEVLEYGLSGDLRGSARQQERAAATDLGVAVTNPELAGDGFLLSADAVALRQQREREFTPTFENGDMLTFGRALAVSVGANPDSTAYNVLSGAVDFGVALTGPGEFAGDAAIAGVRNARLLPGVRSVPVIGKFDPFVEAGGVRSSFRNSVIRPKASEWVDSWRGRKVAERLAEMDNVDDVMMAFGGRIGVSDARLLSNLGTTDEIADYLKLTMGGGIGATPRLGRVSGWRGNLRGLDTFGARLRDAQNPMSRVSRRLGSDIPQTAQLNVFDLDQTYRWAADFLANASVSRGEARVLLDQLARTPGLDRGTFVMREISGLVNTRTFERLMGRYERGLGRSIRRAVSSDAANAAHSAELAEKAQNQADKLTRHFIDRTDDLSMYFIEESGVRGWNPFAILPDGSVADVPRPHSVVEFMHQKLPVPGISDLRSLRRINGPAYEMFSTARLGWLETTGTVGKMALEGLTGVWKPLVLLRPAYVMRVVGEEQARIAAAGGDSVMNNPLSWFVWTLGGGHVGRNADIVGGQLDQSDEFAGSLIGALRDADGARIHVNPLRPRSYREAYERRLSDMRGKVYTRTAFGDASYVDDWAGEIAQMTHDPIIRAVADAGGVSDDLLDEILQNDDFVAQLQRMGERAADTPAGEALARITRGTDDVQVRNAVYDVLESYDARITAKVGDSVELRGAIATDSFGDGGRVTIAGGPTRMKATDEFRDYLQDFAAVSQRDGGVAPTIVKGVKTVDLSETGSRGAERLRTFMDVLGGAIIDRPSSALSRSPVFRQNYWSYVADHGGELSRADAAKILDELASQDAALGTGLPTALRNRIVRSLEGADGTMSADGFDFAAKAHAMEATNDLLFSMTTRKQWADAARVAFPFIEAWQEVLTTWGRQLTTNPQIPRRGQQALTVLGDPDFAQAVESIPGWETIDGQGLVFTDDYGQEVILVPWAKTAGDMLSFAQRAAGNVVSATAALTGGRFGDIGGELGQAAGDVGNALARPFDQSIGSPSGVDRPQQTVPVNALSVAAGILPGLGPSIAVPLNILMTEDQKGEQIFGTEVREILFPFGEPTENLFEGVGEFMPSWAKYAVRSLSGGNYEGASDQAAHASRVISAAKWLIANDTEGKYSVFDEGETAIQNAIRDAESLVAEAAMSSFFTAVFGPSPGRQQYPWIDEDGNVTVAIDEAGAGELLSAFGAAQIQRQLHADGIAAGLSSEDAWDASLLALVDITGSEGSIFATIGASRSRIPGSPQLTEENYYWALDNPEIRQEASLVWGFFAPEQEPGELHLPFLNFLNSGDTERTSLTIDEWESYSEKLAADVLYSRLEDTVGEVYGNETPPDDVRLQLADYARHLNSLFPAWDETIISQAGDTVDAVEELRTVTGEGGILADHEIADGVQAIIAMRDSLDAEATAEAESTARGLRFAESKATRSIRETYAAYLEAVEQRRPELARVIDRVFRAEIRAGLIKDEEE